VGNYDDPSDDSAFFHARYDERLDPANVQSNVIVGDARRYGRVLFVRVTAVAPFRAWLGAFAVSSAADRLVGPAPALLRAIAFTARGLAALAPATAAHLGASSPAFAQGMHARANLLGDHGVVARVVDGSGGVDAMITLCSDDLAALDAADAAIGLAAAAFTVVYRERADRAAPARGNEHFGFEDPISQPGPYGWIQQGAKRLSLTARRNPYNRGEGHPGQPLVPLGHFLLGRETFPGAPTLDVRAHPALTDGAFVAVRLLEQRVGAFHTWVSAQAAALGVSPELVASRVVGRWHSGAPTVRAPAQDDPALGQSTCAWNHFLYRRQVPPISAVFPLRQECTDAPAPGSVDPSGLRCPFSAHVRRSNPRDEVGAAPAAGLAVNPRDTLRRLMLRRSWPYGPASTSTYAVPVADGPDAGRGLIFMAVVASLEAQFEEPTQVAMDPDAPLPGSGGDALLGGAGRTVSLGEVTAGGGIVHAVAAEPWVVAHGGGYFFAPSLALLRDLAAGVAT
jgi:Dyp-type peroxidase family